MKRGREDMFIRSDEDKVTFICKDNQTFGTSWKVAKASETVRQLGNDLNDPVVEVYVPQMSVELVTCIMSGVIPSFTSSEACLTFLVACEYLGMDKIGMTRTDCFNYIRNMIGLPCTIAGLQEKLALPRDDSLVSLNNLLVTPPETDEPLTRPILFQLNPGVILEHLVKPLSIYWMFMLRKTHRRMWSLVTQMMLEEGAKKYPRLSKEPKLTLLMFDLDWANDYRARLDAGYNLEKAKEVYALTKKDLEDLERNSWREYNRRDLMQIALLKHKSLQGIQDAIDKKRETAEKSKATRERNKQKREEQLIHNTDLLNQLLAAYHFRDQAIAYFTAFGTHVREWLEGDKDIQKSDETFEKVLMELNIRVKNYAMNEHFDSLNALVTWEKFKEIVASIK